MAHKSVDWQHNAFRLGSPQLFKAGDKISNGPQADKLAMSPLPFGESPTVQCGGQIRSGPQMSGLATSPMPSKGWTTLPSGGQNEQLPKKGRIGYIVPALWGVPNALEHWTKSEVAPKWADWLHHPCHARGGQRFIAGDKMSSDPQVNG